MCLIPSCWGQNFRLSVHAEDNYINYCLSDVIFFCCWTSLLHLRGFVFFLHLKLKSRLSFTLMSATLFSPCTRSNVSQTWKQTMKWMWERGSRGRGSASEAHCCLLEVFSMAVYFHMAHRHPDRHHRQQPGITQCRVINSFKHEGNQRRNQRQKSFLIFKHHMTSIGQKGFK